MNLLFWKKDPKPKAPLSPDYLERARAALGPLDNDAIAFSAVAEAIAPEGEVEENADRPWLPPVPAIYPGMPTDPHPLPTVPGGHLRFAERMIAQTSALEAGLLSRIDDENHAHAEANAIEVRRHAEAIRDLEAQLADARKTGAFYALAPLHLAPDVPAPAPKPRRRAKKVQPVTEAPKND